MLIGWEAAYLLLVKYVVFINISSYLLASVYVNGRLHTRGWWRAYARMVANKHMKMQLQIQEGTSVNIAVVESVVTPSVPLRIHYAILPLRGLLWEAKASVVATNAHLALAPLKGDSSLR